MGRVRAWEDARWFLAIWRGGSLKRAAADLGVNISTVSRRLDAMEDARGTPLFDRTPDGTLPTAAATALFPFAEAMEQSASDFLHGLDGIEQMPTGKVSIAAPPGLADAFLTDGIHDLLRRHPGLRLEVTAAVAYVDLNRRQADLALRARRPDSGDLVAKRLVTSPWSIVAARTPARALSLRDLARHPWLGWDESLGHLPEAQWLRDHVPDERVVLRSNSMTALLAATRTGTGFMLVPRPYASRPGLTEVPCTRSVRRGLDALPKGELWLTCHRAHRHVPRVAAVWTWLETRFGAS
ncbi:MAG: LysR family transcriptional regulator [Myxococcota bacterium]